VILEAHTAGIAALVERGFPDADLSLLLPHLSIGYTRRGAAADRLREPLRRYRDVELGSGIADEVLLCEVPIAKSTILRPWKVIGSVKLGS